jgi:twinkle protein
MGGGILMKTFQEYGICLPSNASGEVRVICPTCTPTRKHKNDKDLSVNMDKGQWICHHCGWTGGLSAKQEPVAKVYSRPAFIYSELPDGILKWFEGRGIHQKVLADNQITSTNGAIRFPYFKNGECVNVKTRTLDKKFWQETNPEPCLYRFDSLHSEDPLIICEGEIDALSFREIGFYNSTSVPNGAPAPEAKNYAKEFAYLESAMPILEKCQKVILAVDNDLPGKILEQELARRIGVEKCWRAFYPEGCKDANDVLVQHGPHALRGCIENAAPYPVEGIYCAQDVADLVLHLHEFGDRSGLSTGWKILDEFYTIKPGQMSIITGIPGAGKSNWLDALMVNMAVHENWPFAVFSPENWPIERHVQSLIEKLGKRPFGGRSNCMGREEVIEMIRAINDRFFFLMPPEDQMTVDAILDKARIAIFRHGVKGIVIDPWNELEHSFGSLTETQYISAMLGKIRRFARRNGVHIWIVAHPQKLIKDRDTGKYKPPTMYEISGGANWRNKADVGICVHRPDMSNDITEIYVQKIRFREVGKLGAVQFRYARETGNYMDYAVLGRSVQKAYCDTEGYTD